mgnify:CR=1 FL=1
MATYPTAIKSFTNPLATDFLSSPAHATQHTQENDEINAIETELGTVVRGTYSSLVLRLNDVPGTAAYFINAANHTSLQAAINAGSASGGAVFLPAGTYNIGTQLEMYSNMTLFGVGPASVIRATASMVGMLHGTAIGTISVHDIQFDGNDTAKNGIWMENISYYDFSHNFFHDIGTTTEDSNGCIDYWGHHGVVANNNIRDTNGSCRGIFITAGSSFEIAVIGNVFDNCWNGIVSDDGAHHFVIDGNSISNSRAIGIAISTVGSITVSNNTLYWNSPSATSLGISVAGNATTQNKDVIVANNNMNLNRSGGGANGAITLHYLTNVSVTGNVVKNGSALGGIFADNCLDVVITGNRCFDDLGTKAQAYGLYLTGSTDYCAIIGNNFRGNLTGGISAGTGTNNVGTGAGYNITA